MFGATRTLFRMAHFHYRRKLRQAIPRNREQSRFNGPQTDSCTYSSLAKSLTLRQQFAPPTHGRASSKPVRLPGTYTETHGGSSLANPVAIAIRVRSCVLRGSGCRCETVDHTCAELADLELRGRAEVVTQAASARTLPRGNVRGPRSRGLEITSRNDLALNYSRTAELCYFGCSTSSMTSLPFFSCRDHLVDWRVARQGDVDHVVAGIERHVHRRSLLDHALVHCNLSALWLRANAESGLIRIGFASEELRHLADSLDAVDIAERLKRWSKVVGLPKGELAIHGLVEVSRETYQDNVLPLIHAHLRGNFLAPTS